MPYIPGSRVKAIREALRLTSVQFAAVLGVHPTTVYRWEAAGDSDVPVDGVQWNVLSALSDRIEHDGQARAEARDVGAEVAKALLVAGAVVALFLLLSFALKNAKIPK